MTAARAAALPLIPALRPGPASPLAAALDLLAREGPGAITHRRVAQQAGVGRATVYRPWAAPEDLLRDVLFTAKLPSSPLRPSRCGPGCTVSCVTSPTSSPKTIHIIQARPAEDEKAQ